MALQNVQVKTGFPSFTPLYRANGVVVKTYDTGAPRKVAILAPVRPGRHGFRHNEPKSLVMPGLSGVLPPASAQRVLGEGTFLRDGAQIACPARPAQTVEKLERRYQMAARQVERHPEITRRQAFPPREHTE